MSADADFDRVLEAALDRLAAGEALPVILAAYPAQAVALAPLLAAAQTARLTLAGPLPAPNLARGRQRFLQAAAAQTAQAPRRWFAPTSPALVLLALLLAVLVCAVTAAAGVVSASAQALPGEALYPIKRAAEAVQLAVTTDADGRQRLKIEGDVRRRAEIARLLALRRAAAVSFAGVVESVSPRQLLITGLLVSADDAVAYAPGDVLTVEAYTTLGGELIATRLTLVGNVPAVTPNAPLPSATPRAPAATSTPRTPSASPTSRPPQPTATRRAPATERTRASVPTASPTPRDAAATRPNGTAASATDRPPAQTPTASLTPERTSQRPVRAP